MFRVTIRAFIRKASGKAGTKVATPTAAAVGSVPVPSEPSIRAVPPVSEAKVSIPPIPGVRSARAMRRQERAASRLGVGQLQPKKLSSRKHAKPAKVAMPVKASSALKTAANKARSVKAKAQHNVMKVLQGNRIQPKKLSKSLKKSAAKKAHK